MINAFPSAASIGALPITIPGSNVRSARVRCYASLGRLSSSVALEGLRGPVPAPQGFVGEVNATEPAIYPVQAHTVFVAPEHLTTLLGEQDFLVPQMLSHRVFTVDTGGWADSVEEHQRFPRFDEGIQVGDENSI